MDEHWTEALKLILDKSPEGTAKRGLAARVSASFHRVLSLSNANFARQALFTAATVNSSGGYEVAIEGARLMEEDTLKLMSEWPTGPYSIRDLFLEFCTQLKNVPKDALTEAIYGASLIFAHSIFDNALTTFCEIAMIADPIRTLSILGDRKIELRAAKESAFDDLLEQAIKKKTAELSRESIKTRLEFFYGFCPTAPAMQFVPDLERVREIDEIRQDIIHRGDFHRVRADTEDLDFLQRMVSYLAVRFMESHRVLVNMAKIQALPQMPKTDSEGPPS